MPVLRWDETPRGYSVIFAGLRATIFMGQRKRRWSVVIDGAFLDGHWRSLNAAVAYAEENLRTACGRPDLNFDRHMLRDVPPYQRTLDREADNLRAAGGTPNPKQRHRGPLPGGPRGRAKPRDTRPIWVRVLGLEGEGPWTRDQVRAAYRAAAMVHHPDRGGSAERMAAINEAYEIAQKAVPC